MSWNPNNVDGAEALREPRTAKLMSVEISSSRYGPTKVVIRNMSSHGLGIRGDINLLPCELVVVHLPDGSRVGGIVRWANKNTFGLSLDERIDQSALQPRKMADGANLTTRDAEIGFQRIRHVVSGTASRSGFQRTHRAEVLRSSDWTRD
ncbi:MAG: PilZ domain-containing protein [Sphingopyxis sp.]